MEGIHLTVSKIIEINLSKGLHDTLVKKIIKEFRSNYARGARLIYVGNSEKKPLFFAKDELENFGIVTENRNKKMPDVILHCMKKGWFMLIEVVASHGPIIQKRKFELEELFAKSKAELVFITVLADKKSWLNYKGEIAWETNIWIADNPKHMIHLNGKRNFGPYKKSKS